ncbi:hypothetical protein ACJENY_24800, partial [Escherichia coli]
MSNNFKFYALKKTDIFTNKEYTLKIADAKMLSNVFVTLESIGISNTSIERVSYSAIEKIKLEVKARAMENAKQKALV